MTGTRFTVGTIVQKGARIGVVAQDIMSCCEPGESPVVFDGSDSFIGVDASDLTEVGKYETVVSNPEGCGMGQGERCCIYLSFSGVDDFQCQRFSTMRNTLIFRTMTAKRHPTALFQPYCQIGGSRS